MKNKIKLGTATAVAVACSVWLCLTGCTQQQRAKKFGGTATETLPAGRKLVNVTWKGNDLWLLTRPMASNEVAETYEFKESSAWGIVNGTVVIKETK